MDQQLARLQQQQAALQAELSQLAETLTSSKQANVVARAKVAAATSETTAELQSAQVGAGRSCCRLPSSTARAVTVVPADTDCTDVFRLWVCTAQQLTSLLQAILFNVKVLASLGRFRPVDHCLWVPPFEHCGMQPV